MAKQKIASTRRPTTKTASPEHWSGSILEFNALLQGLRLFWEYDNRAERHAQKLALLDQLLALNNACPVPTD
jgi:hypothetical protein